MEVVGEAVDGVAGEEEEEEGVVQVGVEIGPPMAEVVEEDTEVVLVVVVVSV